jgi:hypothetical protein
MLVRNYGFKPPTNQLNAPGDTRATYNSATDRASDPFGGPTNAYVFTNVDEGRAHNITLEARKSWISGWSASLAYNYLDSKDVSSIEAEISSDAFERNATLNHVNTPLLQPSLYGLRNRIIGTVNRTFSYGGGKHATTFSLFLEYAEGGRYSYTYAGDINNDGVFFGNDLLFVPTDVQLNQMQFVAGAFTEQEQRDAYGAFIGQDPYLSTIRGEYAERNAALSPWWSTWDVRILQDLIINENSKFQLSWDILNIGNLISNSWGVRQIPTLTQPISVAGVDATGVPTYSFNPGLNDSYADSFGLSSRWQMQLGLRFIF